MTSATDPKNNSASDAADIETSVKENKRDAAKTAEQNAAEELADEEDDDEEDEDFVSCHDAPPCHTTLSALCFP